MSDKKVSKAHRDAEQMYNALQEIRQYMSPEQLRRKAEKLYGLEYQEALECAYENVLATAKAGLSKVHKPVRDGAQL